MVTYEEGWYWVRSPRFSGRWEPAELDGDELWYFAGCDYPQSYGFVTEVGPRILSPDEPWQCVPKELTESMLLGKTNRRVAYQTVIKSLWKELLETAPKPGEDV